MKRAKTSEFIDVDALEMNEPADDEEDKRSKSTALTQGSGKKKKKEMTELAAIWIEKLPLRPLVEGRKLGVMVRHAEAAQVRMSVKEKLLMSNHLKLCRHAQNLAPDQMNVVSKDTILEAAEALSGHVSVWPETLQRTLWEKAVTELVQGVVSHLTGERLRELWARIRPYGLSTEPAKLSLKDPYLSSMTMKEEEKGAMWMDVLLTRLVLPLLLGGEGKVAVVQGLFTQVLELIAFDLELEMSDRQARGLMNVQSALRGVLCIIELKPTQILDYVEEIEMLKDPHAKLEEGVASVVHAVHEVACYRDKLDAATKLLKTLKLHQREWQCLSQALESEKSLSIKGVQEVHNLFPQLVTLKAEMPAELMKDVLGRMEFKVLDLWQQAHKKMTEGSGADVPVQQLSELLAEAAIWWDSSKNAVYSQAMEFLAEWMQSAKMKERSAKVMDLMLKVPELLVADTELEYYKEAYQVVKEAAGVSFQEEDAKTIAEAVDALAESCLGLVTDDAKTEWLAAWLDLIMASLPWVKGGTCSDKWIFLKNAQSLSQADREFHALGTSMEERLDKDEELAKLGNIIRNRDVFEKVKLETWGLEVATSMLSQSSRCIEMAKTKVMQDSDEHLKSQLKNAGMLAGGRKDGKDWDEGLAGAASFEAIMNRAKQGFLYRNPEEVAEMETATSQLTEARP